MVLVVEVRFVTVSWSWPTEQVSSPGERVDQTSEDNSVKHEPLEKLLVRTSLVTSPLLLGTSNDIVKLQQQTNLQQQLRYASKEYSKGYSKKYKTDKGECPTRW